MFIVLPILRILTDLNFFNAFIFHDMRSESTLPLTGFHPVFNRKFEFDISVPELAIVEFQVMDYESISSNVLVAQCCLPFTSIMPGILFSSCNLTNFV